MRHICDVPEVSIMTTQPNAEQLLIRQLIAGMVIGFGVLFLFVAYHYSQDLALIAATPSIVWQFVCGVPLNDNTTVPLLVSTGSLSMIIGIGLLRFWAKEPQTHNKQRTGHMID